MEKQLKTRIQHKIDTYAHWELAKNFVPLEGELIIYTTDEYGNDKVGLKVGDGKKKLEKLDFINIPSGNENIPGGGILQQIQANWLQNNPEKDDFIKNRPFYEEKWEIEWDATPTDEFIDLTAALNCYAYKVEEYKSAEDIIGSIFTHKAVNGFKSEYEIDQKNIVYCYDENNQKTETYVVIDNQQGILFAVSKEAGKYFTNGMVIEVPTSGIWFGKMSYTAYISLKKEKIHKLHPKFLEKNDSFSSEEITYQLDLPRLCETIEWNGSIKHKPEIEVLSETNPFPEGGQFIKVSDNFINYDDILWGHISIQSSDLNIAGSELQFMATEYSIGLTLTDSLLDRLTIESTNEIFLNQYIVSSKLAGEMSVELYGETVLFNIPEPGTYFYYYKTEDEYFYLTSLVGDIDYSQVRVDIMAIDEIDGLYEAGYQKISSEYTTFNDFSNGLQRIKFSMEDWDQESFIQFNFGKGTLALLADENLAGALVEELDGSWWLSNIMGITGLPIIASIKTPGIKIGDIEFNETGIYFGYLREYDLNKGNWFISYIDEVYKDIIIPIDEKFLPNDKTAVIFGSISSGSDIEALGYNGIVMNMTKYLYEGSLLGVSDIKSMCCPSLRDPEEIYIYSENLFDASPITSNGGTLLLGILDDIIINDDVNIEDLDMIDLSQVNAKCKYKILMTQQTLQNTSSSVIRCIKLPILDNFYLGFEMQIAGGGGDTTNQVIQNSIAPISSGGVWTALGNRSSLVFENEPKQNSSALLTSGTIYNALQTVKVSTADKPEIGNTNPITSEGVYNALGGYKFRVSNKIPDYSDNVDDYTITFVV